MSHRRVFFILIILGLVGAACGTEERSATASNPGTEGSTSTSTSTLGDTVIRNSDVEALAIGDLTTRLGVDSASISVVKAEAKTWPDGSLGCPQPDMSYTQALVEGWQVLLQHDERLFDYHAGDDGQPFLCASEEKDGGYDFVPPPGLYQ